MKSSGSLPVLCVFWLATLNAFCLDREAFDIAHYDLNLRIETDQHRLGARGRITLRNDSITAQKIAVLQISSSLDWLSIASGGKPLPFVVQPYRSDVDHTGMLSEAIVTLPAAVAPGSSVELDVAYDGVVMMDATRLTRIDTPQDAAHNSDWDEIAPEFTAVRGVGYVTWYPIATEDANLADGKSLYQVLGNWRLREEASTMHLHIEVLNRALSGEEVEAPELLVNATTCPVAREEGHQFVADCTYRSLGAVVPTFVIADYEVLERPSVVVHFLRGHAAAAAGYADAAEQASPLITEWFGAARSKAQTADLPQTDAAPFESGPFLLTALSNIDPKIAGLAAAHQLTHAAFFSSRPWINEGLAHFAQALYLEDQKGRQVALDYMAIHRSAFISAEKSIPASSPGEAISSLINTNDEELSRSKAMYVWWMLRDMIGDAALKKAFAAYHPDEDKEPSSLPRLIQAQTQRDLEWFFDDWVYRDRGLPDFKVESAFPRKTMTGAYLVTITVQNLGRAGADVPVAVKFPGGEMVKRVEVRGNAKGVIRIETPKAPQEVVLNDGSVPERDSTNNTFKIETTEQLAP
jgi:hypothetical protein